MGASVLLLHAGPREATQQTMTAYWSRSMPTSNKIKKSTAKTMKMMAMTLATVAAPLATPLKPKTLAMIATTTAAINNSIKPVSYVST